jgi:hypothetical protein
VGKRAGINFFNCIRHELGRLPVIAEDLGEITDVSRSFGARRGARDEGAAICFLTVIPIIHICRIIFLQTVSLIPVLMIMIHRRDGLTI